VIKFIDSKDSGGNEQQHMLRMAGVAQESAPKQDTSFDIGHLESKLKEIGSPTATYNEDQSLARIISLAGR
jgi:hypothetical protein